MKQTLGHYMLSFYLEHCCNRLTSFYTGRGNPDDNEDNETGVATEDINELIACQRQKQPKYASPSDLGKLKKHCQDMILNRLRLPLLGVIEIFDDCSQTNDKLRPVLERIKSLATELKVAADTIGKGSCMGKINTCAMAKGNTCISYPDGCASRVQECYKKCAREAFEIDEIVRKQKDDISKGIYIHNEELESLKRYRVVQIPEAPVSEPDDIVLRFLHLSDFHFGAGDEAFQDANDAILASFKEDVQQLEKDLGGGWDFIAITGDIAYSGKRDQYYDLETFLSKIWSSEKRPVIISVPGNHDLERLGQRQYAKFGTPQMDLLEATNALKKKLVSKYQKRSKAAVWKVTRKSFANYSAWAEAACFKAGETSTIEIIQQDNGCLPGDFSATVKFHDKKIGLIGLNTAFLQMINPSHTKKKDKPEKNKDPLCGQLGFFYEQFAQTCPGQSVNQWQNEEHDYRILLTHHPSNWFSQPLTSLSPGIKGKNFSEAIWTPGKFSIHLGGHMHEPDMTKMQMRLRKNGEQILFTDASFSGIHPDGENIYGYTAFELVFKKDGTKHLFCYPRIASKQLDYKFKPNVMGYDLCEPRGCPLFGVIFH